MGLRLNINASKDSTMLSGRLPAASEGEKQRLEEAAQLLNQDEYDIEEYQSKVEYLIRDFGVPLPYAAIMDQNTEMLEFLIGQDVELEADRMEEICCQVYVETDAALRIRKSSAERQITNPLSAAIGAGEEMVRYVAEKVPAISWNYFLEEDIMQSGEKMTKLLLTLYPEIPELLSMEALFQSKNYVLVNALQEKGGAVLEEKRREFEKILEEEDRTKKMLCRACKEDQIVYDEDWKQMADFIHGFCEMIPGRQTASLFRKRIYRKLDNSTHSEPDEKLLVEAFFNLAPRELEDFTEEILQLPLYEYYNEPEQPFDAWTVFCGALTKLGKGKKKPFLLFRPDVLTTFGVDIFIETPEAVIRCAKVLTAPSGQSPLLRNILNKNKQGLVRLAINNGYITPDNALELYTYAAECPNMQEEILQLLIRMAGKKGMEERV